MEKHFFVSDAVLASRLIPSGVLCLFTAVDYYDLSTVNPRIVSMAVPRNFTLHNLPSQSPFWPFCKSSSHDEQPL